MLQFAAAFTVRTPTQTKTAAAPLLGASEATGEEGGGGYSVEEENNNGNGGCDVDSGGRAGEAGWGSVEGWGPHWR